MFSNKSLIDNISLGILLIQISTLLTIVTSFDKIAVAILSNELHP